MSECLTDSALAAYINGSARPDEVVRHLAVCDACLLRLAAVTEFDKSRKLDLLAGHADELHEIDELLAAATGSATQGISDTDLAEVDAVRKAVEEKKARKKSVPEARDTAPPALVPTRPPQTAFHDVRRTTTRLTRSRKKGPDLSMFIVLGCVVAAIVLGAVFYKRLSAAKGDRNPVQTSGGGAVPEYVNQMKARPRSTALLSDCTGNVEVKESGAFLKVGNEKNVFADNEVRTDGAGFVCLSFSSGTLVYCTADTLLKIGPADLPASGTAVSCTLMLGSAFVVVPEGVDAGGFRMTAGSVTVAAPGSEFLVTRKGGGTLLACVKGAVIYREGLTPEQSLAEKMTLETGGKPQPLDMALLDWVNYKGIRYALAPKERAVVEVSADGAPLVDESFSFKETFEDAALSNHWRIIGKGAWLPRQGKCVHSSDEARGMLLFKGRAFQFCTLTTYARSGGNGGIGLVFGYGGSLYGMYRWGADGSSEIITVRDGTDKVEMTRAGTRPEEGKFYLLRIDLQGTSVRVDIDGTMVLNTRIDGLGSGQVGLLADGDSDAVFDTFFIQLNREEVPRF